ncbi:MAG: hypothetical protein AB8H80_01335 [Planctomycetota bacterium]
MKRTSAKGRPANDLPSFLGNAPEESAPPEASTEQVEAEYEEDDDGHEDFEDRAEHDEDSNYGEDDAIVPEDDDQDGAEESFEEDSFDEEGGDNREPSAARRYEPGLRTRSRARRNAARAAAEKPGGSFAMIAGMLIAVAGLAAMIAPAFGNVLHNVGIEPQMVSIMGLVLFGIGAGQRRAGWTHQRIFQLEEQRANDDERMLQSIETLLQEFQERSGTNPAATPTTTDSGEVQHVLLSLQRQDQKINNLTKAIKMYGKPLMEIANQCSDLASRLGKVKTLVEGSSEMSRQGLHRVAESIRDGGKTDLGNVPEQIQKLEVALAALSQRHDNSDVQKSLHRLEEASKEINGQVVELQRGDSIKAAATSLQERLDQATNGLEKGIEELRDGNLGGLETSVREIQREVASLATGLAQLQAAVNSGARAPAAAAHAPAPTPARATAATPKAGAGGGGGGESGSNEEGYSTGKRKSGGKNVLGAIAKLKQMKG